MKVTPPGLKPMRIYCWVLSKDTPESCVEAMSAIVNGMFVACCLFLLACLDSNDCGTKDAPWISYTRGSRLEHAPSKYRQTVES